MSRIKKFDELNDVTNEGFKDFAVGGLMAIASVFGMGEVKSQTKRAKETEGKTYTRVDVYKNNARTHMQEDGIITTFLFGVGKDRNIVNVIVEDTGTGEIKSKILKANKVNEEDGYVEYIFDGMKIQKHKNYVATVYDKGESGDVLELQYRFY